MATTTANVPSHLTTFISGMEGGYKILPMFGDIDFPDKTEVKGQEKALAVTLKDLIAHSNNQASGGATGHSGIGRFVESLYKACFVEDRVTLEDASLIAEAIRRVMSKGIKESREQAMSGGSSDDYNYRCASCGCSLMKYNGELPKNCPVCKEPVDAEKSKHPMLNVDKSLVYEAVMEFFCLCDSLDETKGFEGFDAKVEFMSGALGIKIPKVIVSEKFFGKSPQLLSYLGCSLSEAVTGVASNSPLKEDVGLKEDFAGIGEALPEVYLSVLYPVLKKGSGLYTPQVWEALDRAYCHLRDVDESALHRFSVFKDMVYDKKSNALDVAESFTADKANLFAKSLLGEPLLERLRMEIDKRPTLFRNIKGLNFENFDTDKAYTVISSCVTRVCIEHSISDKPELHILRMRLVESMADLTKGYRNRAINFVKGVFLRPGSTKP